MASILVVDDVGAMRATIRLMLEKAGHAVTEAGNGNEALAALAEKDFDIVVADMVMPEMNGVELLRQIAERSHAVGIVAISGGGDLPASITLALSTAYGAFQTLYKPFDRAELLNAVTVALERQALKSPKPAERSGA
jgi:DNA-binding NtrC family response regulator